MEYAEFFKKFGRSTRSKNIAPSLLKQLLSVRKRQRNGRPFARPATSSLPAEFIRLCPWEAEYMFTVARRAKKGILETGRYNGGSAFLFACANPTVPIFSIDIAPKDDTLVRSLLDQNGIGRNVDIIVGDSQHTKYTQIKEVDFLFIDGDHSYEGCMADLVNWYDHLVPGGHLLVHDCYLGAWGVQDAVLDFMATHPELAIVKSPIIAPTYWHYEAGSLGHLVRTR